MTKLAYILAASHSGSTLLAMLLGSHPETCTVGELKLSPRAIGDIDRYRCSCGEFIRKCPFWNDVNAGMAKRGFDFDIASAGTDYGGIETSYARRLLRPLHRGRMMEAIRDMGLCLLPAWRKQYPQIQRRNAALVATVAEITGAKIIIDSSKTAVRLKYLLRNPELDVKVIRLIRDGRAVALTYMDPAGFADAKDTSLRGGGSGGDRATQRLTMSWAACQWRRSNEEAEHLLAGLDRSHWTEVRYEEYCSDLDTTLGRLFEFLGVDPQDCIPDFRSREHHVVGNGMRLDTTSEVCLDERWRTRLFREHLRVFNLTGGELNERYGYSASIGESAGRNR